MQYVFLICSSAGGKSDVFLSASARAYQKHVLHGQETVSIFIANIHAIFNDILRKKAWDFPLLRITTVSESVMGRVLNFSQTMVCRIPCCRSQSGLFSASAVNVP